MNSTRLLARCAAAAAATAIIAGLAAIPAPARPDPGPPVPDRFSSDDNCLLSRVGTQYVKCDKPRPQHEAVSQSQPQTAVGGTKAQLERNELLERRTKAAIEHDESMAQEPAAKTVPPDDSSALPWVVGGIALLGVAGVAAAAGAARPRRRTSRPRAA
jgi:hypothetical protein